MATVFRDRRRAARPRHYLYGGDLMSQRTPSVTMVTGAEAAALSPLIDGEQQYDASISFDATNLQAPTFLAVLAEANPRVVGSPNHAVAYQAGNSADIAASAPARQSMLSNPSVHRLSIQKMDSPHLQMFS